jgi:uncharacterized BrkB/YihY/UPF0761 family membrane protein
MEEPRHGDQPTWTQHPKVASLRRRHVALDLAVETAEGFQRHRTSQSSALLAHYSFLSVFPLLLVFVTLIGFVLQNRPDLQEDVVDSTLANIPIIGPQLVTDAAGLRGSGWALVFGLVLALWAGLRAFVGIAYQVLSTQPLRWRSQVLPGAVPVGIVLAALHLVGTVVVGRAIARAAPVYGAFATVIALLTWLSLLSIVLLAGAELNAAVERLRRLGRV